ADSKRVLQAANDAGAAPVISELAEGYDTVLGKMFTGGVGRRWCAICLGGGVLEDMSGFVASTFKRGIDFLQIPTTLLSMVDSSVGGKLGVDFNQLKNSIGVFANPIAVWIDPVFLKTLSAREIRSGYGEIIKHGLIADQEQWETILAIKDLKTVNWQSIIPASVNVKREIVLVDPFEGGLRKALNFGHTIGHAIESYWLATPSRLLHGEAIAAGMAMEAWLSVRLSSLKELDLNQIARYILDIYGHQLIPEEAFSALLNLMRQDKKNEDERINFTLLEAPGKAVVNATAEGALIEEAMRWYNSQVVN
ncbi:MAG: 3-dehydroquinate synthase family protein, partial [Bacteroidota bacterium]